MSFIAIDTLLIRHYPKRESLKSMHQNDIRAFTIKHLGQILLQHLNKVLGACLFHHSIHQLYHRAFIFCVSQITVLSLCHQDRCIKQLQQELIFNWILVVWKRFICSFSTTVLIDLLVEIINQHNRTVTLTLVTITNRCNHNIKNFLNPKQLLEETN